MGLKGMGHPKMKITPRFTHAQAILGVLTLLFQTNTIGVILNNVLALPSFIMAVNSSQDFEAKIKHKSIIKSFQHGSWGIKVF